MVIVLPACRRELAVFPEDIRGDLADAIARLDAGLMLSMPLSRPMPSIGRGVHELRLKHAALAEGSGPPRSAVTGILSGSLQKVTIDRVLRLVEAAGLEAEIRIHRAA